MNILIDYLASNTGGGKTVAENQIKNLLRLDKKNKYIILTRKGADLIEKEKNENCKIIEIDYKNIFHRLFFQFIQIKNIVKENKIDILFFPNNYITYFNSRLPIILFHQNTNIYYPEYIEKKIFTIISNTVQIILAKISYKKATVNVFNSNFIKGKNLGVVNYLGIKHEKCSRELIKEKKFDLVTVTSNFSAHKNMIGLLRAVKHYRNRYDKELKVLIVGGDGKKGRIERIKNYIEKSGINNIKITGIIRKDEVKYNIIKSRLFISTSLLESFSLTQFEALNCNIPIILSDIPVFREVCGDYDIYFNPNNPEDIADKIHDVFENYEYYVNMIPEIKKYASKFTWENHARKLIEIFNSYEKN